MIDCVWEHNGQDTILYAADYPGAFARGASLSIAEEKMEREIRSWCMWAGWELPGAEYIRIAQDYPCSLDVSDADSDVLLYSEEAPLGEEEYSCLKELALCSAKDFLKLYSSFPDKNQAGKSSRKTFYGMMPVTVQEIYDHTKSVNAYYFAEIGVDANNAGSILECRQQGFALLEQIPDFLNKDTVIGSYGERWNLRKVLRRFLWHDRIHAKSLYRIAGQLYPGKQIPDPFCFSVLLRSEKHTT